MKLIQRRQASAFEPPQQLYSLPPSAPPLLTDGGGPPARASASAPETVHLLCGSTGAAFLQSDDWRRVLPAGPLLERGAGQGGPLNARVAG
jgi:hypothetical protein